MSRLRLKVRFDYAAEHKPNKRLFGNKNNNEQAEEVRQQRVATIRNIPIQGITIDDIDMSQDIYSLFDEFLGRTVFYAPVTIVFTADSLEDAVKFTMKEEFRTIELMEPSEMVLSSIEVVRLLQKINAELINYKQLVERRMENWR